LSACWKHMPDECKNREASGNGRIDPLVWRIAGVVLFGPLMTSLDSTIVNVSLSKLGQELHASLAVIQWSPALPARAGPHPSLSGWLVDRIGAKRVYLGCFAAFTAASMLCGAATSAGALIGFRVLQGMAGGLLAPMAQMMTAARLAAMWPGSWASWLCRLCLVQFAGRLWQESFFSMRRGRWIFFINLQSAYSPRCARRGSCQ